MFTIFLSFFFIHIINSQSCTSDMTIGTESCYNSLKIFNIEYYRSGHFAINKNGDMIVEYSFNSSRLFYGLKNDGKLYYPNEIKEVEIESETIPRENRTRYEALNLFVSLYDDINRDKEYLISMSSYVTILELFDIENNNYYIYPATDFFEHQNGTYSYIFQLLETKYNNKNVYFCTYITLINNETLIKEKNIIWIKRFGLSDTNFGLTEEKKISIEYNEITRITSSILYDNFHILAVFYRPDEEYKLRVNLYDYELEIKNSLMVSDFIEPSYGNGHYFKACILKEGYTGFIYFINGYKYVFKILNLKIEENSYETKLYYGEDYYTLNHLITLNEFLKIDDERMVFLSTTENTYLYIIMFDIYQDYTYVKIRYYSILFSTDIISLLSKELSGFIYNGYLAFTATVIPRGENALSEIFFPVFLIFGYANGTDFEIDIYPYLSDTADFTGTKNLYEDLIAEAKIDNNIFGYEMAEKIKLISIPEELLFFDDSSETPLSDNSEISSNYVLKQNEQITIKTDEYYYLEYQFIVKEPDYEKFYTPGTNLKREKSVGERINDTSIFYRPRYFYGRTNTLKFKLCHIFCKTCKTMGNPNSITDQKCESCLDQYTQITKRDSSIICKPEGYFFIEEEQTIEKCGSTYSKFYIDLNTSEIICFKKSEDCPIGYENYDKKTGECKPGISIEAEIGILINTSSNMTNEEINSKIEEILNNYKDEYGSIEVKGENNTVFQLTTTDNENKKYSGNISNENDLSIIDLGDCETSLRNYYNISYNLSLIIKKYEQLTSSAEKSVQYEVYHPITKEQLNLSVCEADTISLYIPVELNEELLALYEELQNSGYDLFNIEDPFYNDICATYTTSDGTDVLLSDRKNDYYSNNYTTCQSNCEYTSFDSGSKLLKCECNVVAEDIDISDLDKFSKNIYKNFYDVLKNSNYKTLKCYKLVFNSEFLKKNIGSFVVISFFVLYLCSFIIYTIKGIKSLQEEAIMTLANKFTDVNIKILEKSLLEGKIKDSLKENKKIVEPPPKKLKNKISDSNLIQEGKNNEKKKKNKKRKRRKARRARKSSRSYRERKRSRNEINISVANSKISEFGTKKNMNEETEKNKIAIFKSSTSMNKFNDIPNKQESNLDDLDLNNLKYEKAVDLDKRTLFQIYWSRLKSKHMIIYTFFSWHDHNLIYIKVARFIFLICTSMAMNVIFFSDSSMHKLYVDYGVYNFLQQIPQIIYSSLVSLVIEILIGFLSFTDNNIYQIRQIEEFEPEKIKKIFKKMKIKLIMFFVVTFLFFAFYWYLISSFCAVYTNTQVTYIKDSVSSFCLGLVYPFIIQFCFALLRIFALRDKNSCSSFLYKFC